MKWLKVAKRTLNSTTATNLNLAASIETIDYESAEIYKNIPGPKPIPILGNTWRFLPVIGNFQIEHIDKVSKSLYEKYGKIVKVEGLIGRPDMVFLFDPDDIEKVFRLEDAMPFRPSMPSLNYYKHVYRKEFFGEMGGVIAVHGENWQKFRTKVNQIMLQPRVTKKYVKSIANTAHDFITRIEQIKDKNEEVDSNFLNEIHKWSLESIAKIALDVRLGCFDQNANEETQQLIDAVNTFFINVPILELKIPFWRVWNTPTFNAYISALDTIRAISMKHINGALKKAEFINNSEKNIGNEDLSVLQRVLQMDNNATIASNLALDLFLVGIDTTSNAVASILYQLAINKDKQKLLFSEIEKVLPETNMEITNEKLDQMIYLKACIKETMRMYPVVIGNGRCTTSDRVIGGYQIPKGVQIIFQHYVISNLDKYFPESGKFLPERWIKGCLHNRNHHPFASLPFGFGKRMCLGRRFADLEIQTVLLQIIRNFEVKYNYEPLDYHIHPMYTPNGPLRFQFTKRKSC